MPAPAAPASPRPGRGSTRPAARGRVVPPILARQMRNGIEESVHRGDIVEVDVGGTGHPPAGRPGPDRHAPLGGQAVRAPRAHRGRRDQGVRPRAGRDSRSWPAPIRVRTSTSGRSRGSIAGPGVSQAHLGNGSDGAPLDALTAARLARDGEKPGPIRHMCSGAHTGLPAAVPDERLGSGRLLGAEPPSQVPIRDAVARHVRDDAGEARDRDRRLRGRDVRLPAARGRARLRDARRPDRRSRPATLARISPAR